MKQIIFRPGPSQLYPGVASAIAESIELGVGSWSHRGQEFHDCYAGAESALRKLLKLPDDWTMLLFSSATEVMERLVQCCSRKKTAHLVSGAFSKRFYDISTWLGRDATRVEWPSQEPPTGEQELLCLTQCETSRGHWLSKETVEAWRAAHPDALIAIDMVSSLPLQPLGWQLIDSAFFSVQKGFGLPPGMGVGFFSNRAIERARGTLESGSYHQLARMSERAQKHETIETPNTLSIFLLGRVAEAMYELGMDKIEAATMRKAKKLYAAAEAISGIKAHGNSQTVLVADVKAGTGLAWVEKLAMHGFAIGPGYGPYKHDQIRIANFPAHQEDDVERLIEAMHLVAESMA